MKKFYEVTTEERRFFESEAEAINYMMNSVSKEEKEKTFFEIVTNEATESELFAMVFGKDNEAEKKEYEERLKEELEERYILSYDADVIDELLEDEQKTENIEKLKELKELFK